MEPETAELLLEKNRSILSKVQARIHVLRSELEAVREYKSLLEKSNACLFPSSSSTTTSHRHEPTGSIMNLRPEDAYLSPAFPLKDLIPSSLCLKQSGEGETQQQQQQEEEEEKDEKVATRRRADWDLIQQTFPSPYHRTFWSSRIQHRLVEIVSRYVADAVSRRMRSNRRITSDDEEVVVEQQEAAALLSYEDWSEISHRLRLFMDNNKNTTSGLNSVAVPPGAVACKQRYFFLRQLEALPRHLENAKQRQQSAAAAAAAIATTKTQTNQLAVVDDVEFARRMLLEVDDDPAKFDDESLHFIREAQREPGAGWSVVPTKREMMMMMMNHSNVHSERGAGETTTAAAASDSCCGNSSSPQEVALLFGLFGFCLRHNGDVMPQAAEVEAALSVVRAMAFQKKQKELSQMQQQQQQQKGGGDKTAYCRAIIREEEAEKTQQQGVRDALQKLSEVKPMTTPLERAVLVARVQASQHSTGWAPEDVTLLLSLACEEDGRMEEDHRHSAHIQKQQQQCQKHHHHHQYFLDRFRALAKAPYRTLQSINQCLRANAILRPADHLELVRIPRPFAAAASSSSNSSSAFSTSATARMIAAIVEKSEQRGSGGVADVADVAVADVLHKYMFEKVAPVVMDVVRRCGVSGSSDKNESSSSMPLERFAHEVLGVGVGVIIASQHSSNVDQRRGRERGRKAAAAAGSASTTANEIYAAVDVAAGGTQQDPADEEETLEF